MTNEERLKAFRAGIDDMIQARVKELEHVIIGTIIGERDSTGTDELCVMFYRCNKCGFERVPHQRDCEFARQTTVPEEVTAKFCPGCGAQIRWAL